MFSKRIFMLLVKQISLKLFLRIAHENTVSSELFNRDADMASEIGKFTSNQIMVEASTVIRAQAIKSSLDILKLLLRVSLALFPKRIFFTENLQERLSYNWVLDLYLINIGAGQSRSKESAENQQAVSI